MLDFLLPPLRHVAVRSLLGSALLVLVGSIHGLAQADLTPEALRSQAMSAFDNEDWELAHRRLAELLSLDGTDTFLQMRYAATLLHDARLREEGIQRLASLADQGALSGEGLYWWGRAWMLQGQPEQAVAALNEAVASAPKKAVWLNDCQLALAQAQAMPVSFETRQALQRLDVVDVPMASFHRYIQWDREGVRLMLAPEEVRTKKDNKKEVQSPIAFWRGTPSLFYHSLGSKGETGLDLWIASLNGEGEFGELERLPEPINSAWDDQNPVWDPSSRCLTFSSNRPATVGGMDLFQTCQTDAGWGPVTSMGPLYNSVHDDVAFYPPSENGSGWLVTGREAAYGGVQVWEVLPDGPPTAPVRLTTQWEVSGDVVPGTLELRDAETNKPLAEVELSEARGQWDVVVASGTVVRYAFQTSEGATVEGTYAVPEVSEASVVTQRMAMAMVGGEPFLEARPLTREATSTEGLRWGWDMVLDEVQDVEVEPWDMPEEEVVLTEPVAEAPRRVVQFQSYPWWTEAQKEERAIASNVLSAYMPDVEVDLPRASEFDSFQGFQAARNQASKDVLEQAVSAVLANASARVLLEELPFEDALSAAVQRASALWPVGTLNVEEVVRKARRTWARSGALYDQGALPEVRDKRALVGDGDWVEEPWENGQVAALAAQSKALVSTVGPSDRLVWALSHQPHAEESWGERWLEPQAWDVDAVRQDIDAIARSGQELEVGGSVNSASSTLKMELDLARQRLGLLEAMEPVDAWTEEDVLDAIQQWKGIAVELAQTLELEQEDAPSVSVIATLEEELNEDWQAVWTTFMDDLRTAERLDAPFMDVGPTGTSVLNWRNTLVGWLREREKTSSASWLLKDVVAEALAHNSNGAGSESTGRLQEVPSGEGLPRDPSNALLTMKNDLLQQVERLAATLSPGQDAPSLLTATWVLSLWTHSPEWQALSPDQVVAMIPEVPGSLSPVLQDMRVVWARQTQEVEEVDPTPAHALDNPDEDLSDAAGATESMTSTDGENPSVEQETLQEASPGDALKDSEKEQNVMSTLESGALGLHMGWFRNEPQVSRLPQGTTLESEAGRQGLVRWVLVLPEAMTEAQWNNISSWLVKQGVTDAYEVQYNGQSWGVPESDAPVQAVADMVQTGDETSNARETQSTSNSEGSREETDRGQEASQGDAQTDDWGGDEVWAHGAPVQLERLRGEWYAVQVGAFKGAPKKAWIEKAGERLVYEPFDDGLARWYAGVRQDKEGADERLRELKRFAEFSDAFVVRLNNGVREVIRLGEGDNMAQSASSAEVETVAGASVGTESQGATAAAAKEDDASNLAGSESSRTQEPEAQASPVLAPTAGSAGEKASTWHVDIARYYGTVPSKDVASLLFKAADWGVRSVELFGQTTYFSRTVQDLAEAERLLKDIQKEGFDNAVLVEEE